MTQITTTGMNTKTGTPPQRFTLYRMRQLSGKSGSAVARLCGTTYRSLRNWESGATIPNIVNIWDLLQIYGYSFYELDMEPFYNTYHLRTGKLKRADSATDNPLRDRRQFEQALHESERRDVDQKE